MPANLTEEVNFDPAWASPEIATGVKTVGATVIC